jgi:hypothetical protein
MKFESARLVGASLCALVGFGPAMAAAPAPCGLLSPAQVSSAMGATAGPGQPIGTTGCSWSAPHIVTTVSLWPGDADHWQKMKAPMAGITRTAVAGIGDDAVQTTIGEPGRELTTLTIKKGNTAYMIRVYGTTVTNQSSIEKALAGDLLRNL